MRNMITVKHTKVDFMAQFGFPWVVTDEFNGRIIGYLEKEEDAHIAALALMNNVDIEISNARNFDDSLMRLADVNP